MPAGDLLVGQHSTATPPVQCCDLPPLVIVLAEGVAPRHTAESWPGVAFRAPPELPKTPARFAERKLGAAEGRIDDRAALWRGVYGEAGAAECSERGTVLAEYSPHSRIPAWTGSECSSGSQGLCATNDGNPCLLRLVCVAVARLWFDRHCA